MSDDMIRPGSGLSPADRATVERLYRAFVGEPDLLDGVVTPDWQDIPLAPGQAPGREGTKPLIRALNAAVPDLAITVHDMLGDGDRIGVRAEMSGTHAGAWFGVAPTGKAFRIALHEFHRIENGRLTHTWHLEDWFSWLNQIGAWPAHQESAS